MTPHHLTEHLSTPFVDSYDVVVAGGGASGLIAAAKVGGVERVTLAVPAQDIVCADAEIPYLSDLQVTTLVLD